MISVDHLQRLLEPEVKKIKRVLIKQCTSSEEDEPGAAPRERKNKAMRVLQNESTEFENFETPTLISKVSQKEQGAKTRIYSKCCCE